MERQTFKTLIKQDHELNGNAYICGRLYGIAEIICELYAGIEELEDDDGIVRVYETYRGSWLCSNDETLYYLKMICTQEQYEKFKEYVENVFPGLCEFYWEKDI